MKGLLCIEGCKEELLCFVCDLCHKEHSIFVSKQGPYVRHDKINVWGYKFIDQQHLAVYPNLYFDSNGEAKLELHPSMDNSQYCGMHTGVNWLVDVKILANNEYRTETTEAWLNSG